MVQLVALGLMQCERVLGTANIGLGMFLVLVPHVFAYLTPYQLAILIIITWYVVAAEAGNAH